MAELLIATKAFCNTLKSGSFSGDTTMCPTRSQIEAAGLHIKKGNNYETDQLVPQDHIERLDWEYTFTVSPESVTIPASGGSRQFTVTSYKKQYSTSNSGSHVFVEGSQTEVSYSSENSGSGSWNSGTNTITYGANQSSEVNGTVTWTQAESGKKVTATHSISEDTIKSYSDPVVTLSYDSEIPASGKSSVTPNYSYSQTVTWESGKTTTIASGGTLTFKRMSGTATIDSSSGIASATSKGTTPSSKTEVGKVTLTVVLNGKTGVSSEESVYQQKNESSESWGEWNVTCTADPLIINATGGTSTLSGRASREGTRTWTSESTESISSGEQTVTEFHTRSQVAGFSLSGNKLTAEPNSGTSKRTISIYSTYSGKNSNDLTIEQSAASETSHYEYKINISPTTESFIAKGESKVFTIESQRRLVTENSTSGTTHGDWEDTDWKISKFTNTGFSNSISGKKITVTASANANTSERTGSIEVQCIQSESTKTSAEFSQKGAELVSKTVYEFTVDSSPLNFSKEGGTKVVSVVSRSKIEYTNSVDNSITYSEYTAVDYRAESSNSAFSSTTPTGTETNSAIVSVGANTGAERSSTITYTQNQSNKTLSVECTQEVGVQYRKVRKYEFSVNPTALSFESNRGSDSLTFTSRYQEGTQSNSGNGWETDKTVWGSDWVEVEPSVVISEGGEVFSQVKEGNTVTVTATSNTSIIERTGVIEFSQTREGLQEDGTSWSSPANINVPLSQKALVINRRIVVDYLGSGDLTLRSTDNYKVYYFDSYLQIRSGSTFSDAYYCSLIGSNGFPVKPGDNSLKKILKEININHYPSQTSNIFKITKDTTFNVKANFIMNSATPSCSCSILNIENILINQFYFNIGDKSTIYISTKRGKLNRVNQSSGGGYNVTLDFTSTEKIFKNQRTFKVVSLIEALYEETGISPSDINSVGWGYNYYSTPVVSLDKM